MAESLEPALSAIAQRYLRTAPAQQDSQGTPDADVVARSDAILAMNTACAVGQKLGMARAMGVECVLHDSSVRFSWQVYGADGWCDCLSKDLSEHTQTRSTSRLLGSAPGVVPIQDVPTAVLERLLGLQKSKRAR